MAQIEVLLGNPEPITAPEHINQAITTVVLREDVTDPEYVELTLQVPEKPTRHDRLIQHRTALIPAESRLYSVAVHDIEEVWLSESAAAAPSWVSVPSDPAFQELLASHFNCLSGEPVALQVTAGVDAMFAQNLNVGSQPAAFGWGCLSANTTTPSAADTSITAEITTAGGGLIRHTMTYAHTGGASTATMTNTFTANGSDSLPVTIGKYGLLNASSVGTLGYEDLISPTVTISSSGNSITVTHTITI